jgi:hypothetical protein
VGALLLPPIMEPLANVPPGVLDSFAGGQEAAIDMDATTEVASSAQSVDTEVSEVMCLGLRHVPPSSMTFETYYSALGFHVSYVLFVGCNCSSCAHSKSVIQARVAAERAAS